jgi:hypothetical protein
MIAIGIQQDTLQHIDQTFQARTTSTTPLDCHALERIAERR